MKNTSFRKLREKEKRARLLGVIACKTAGKLSKEELEEIVNNIDISNQHSISVLHDAKEFAKKLQLEFSSWSDGEDYDMDREHGEVLLGSNLEFGAKVSSKEYFNGNLRLEEDRTSCSDFEITSRYAVSILHVSDSSTSFGYNETRDYSETYSLVIYIPAQQPFKVAPEVQSILEKFNIK